MLLSLSFKVLNLWRFWNAPAFTFSNLLKLKSKRSKFDNGDTAAVGTSAIWFCVRLRCFKLFSSPWKELVWMVCIIQLDSCKLICNLNNSCFIFLVPKIDSFNCQFHLPISISGTRFPEAVHPHPLSNLHSNTAIPQKPFSV